MSAFCVKNPDLPQLGSGTAAVQGQSANGRIAALQNQTATKITSLQRICVAALSGNLLYKSAY
jgi:hypothetical protein